MVITIGNQKGGQGKSTLTILLANFLALNKEYALTVIDMDYQQTIARKFEREKILENSEPYNVLPATPESFAALRDILSGRGKELLLVDLPGKLDDEGLVPVLSTSDLVICPFCYNEFSVDSTLMFAALMRKINPKIDLVFLPNHFRKSITLQIIDDVRLELEKFGTIVRSIYDRVDFQQTNTFQTPPSLFWVVEPTFEQIFQRFIQGKKEIAAWRA